MRRCTPIWTHSLQKTCHNCTCRLQIYAQLIMIATFSSYGPKQAVTVHQAEPSRHPKISNLMSEQRNIIRFYVLKLISLCSTKRFRITYNRSSGAWLKKNNLRQNTRRHDEDPTGPTNGQRRVEIWRRFGRRVECDHQNAQIDGGHGLEVGWRRFDGCVEFQLSFSYFSCGGLKITIEEIMTKFHWCL